MRIATLVFLFQFAFLQVHGTSLVYPFPTYYDEEKEEKASFFPAYETKKDYEKLILDNCSSLQAKLEGKIFGQELAVKQLSEAIIRFAAGVNDPEKPIASMLFYGPSGVGKTELVNQLCTQLYGDTQDLVRLNMSEYSEAHSISRLIGAPPGYLGYQEGGQLSNAILKNPHSIILLDEAEKAHIQVLKTFLHIFDNGIFTSAAGKKIDCRKCIFILTSNLGTFHICELYKENYSSEEIAEAVRPIFLEVLSPELFNRVEPILFVPLTQDLVEKLVYKNLAELASRIFTQKQITLTFDPTLVAFLAEHGMDPLLGARPLKRLIDKELTTVIARALLEGKFPKKTKLLCSYADSCVIVSKIP